MTCLFCIFEWSSAILFGEHGAILRPTPANVIEEIVDTREAEVAAVATESGGAVATTESGGAVATTESGGAGRWRQSPGGGDGW